MSDHIYIKNKNRSQSIINNKLRASHKHTPEYVKHDIEPEERSPVDISDTLYVQKNQPISQKTPGSKSPVKRGPPAPIRYDVNSGNNYEHTWYEEDPNVTISYDEVPLPPEMVNDEVEGQPLAEVDSANSVEPGDYVILVDGEKIHVSSDIEEIEEAIQLLVYDRKAAQMDEISVFKRLNVKLGVSVRDD